MGGFEQAELSPCKFKSTKSSLKPTRSPCIIYEKVVGHDEDVQRRREEMEAQAERATAQHRHLQDDVKAVRMEARERTEQGGNSID